jgi:hypothetical protein
MLRSLVQSGRRQHIVQLAPHVWLVAAKSPLPPVPDAGKVAVLVLVVGSTAGAAGVEEGVGAAPMRGTGNCRQVAGFSRGLTRRAAKMQKHDQSIHGFR